IAGFFPYQSETELAPGRFEVFDPRSLNAGDDVRLLVGHDWARPLASVSAGSLQIRNDAAGISFTATIPPAIAGTSHGHDAIEMARAGLSVGLSPGFTVAANGDRMERRGAGLLRTISAAVLHELSVVTRGAYGDAAISARSWVAGPELGAGGPDWWELP